MHASWGFDTVSLIDFRHNNNNEHVCCYCSNMLCAARRLLTSASRQSLTVKYTEQCHIVAAAGRPGVLRRTNHRIHSSALTSSSRRRILSYRSTPSPPSFRRGIDGNGYGPYERQGRSDIPLYMWVGGFGIPLTGLTYLYVAYLDRVPLTGRQRWIATSPEWERKMGDEEYHQLLVQFQGQILPSDHRASIMVQRVGHRIYDAAKGFCEDYHASKGQRSTVASPPTFTVVRSDMANAFVLPNNHIFVMTGLFRYAQTEEELASVLGHEMAHNLARHVGEKISGNMVVQVVAKLTLLVDPSGALMMLIVPAANLLRELPHSRTQELEADHIGMHLAARACYDPAAAKNVFSRMKQDSASGLSPPEFLSTHPSHDSRLVKMDDWIPEARKVLYRDGGEPCRRIRREIELAQRIAARRAAEREVLLRRMAEGRNGPFQ